MHEFAEAPTRSTMGSVGYDIKACLETPIEIKPGETVLVSSGFAIELEHGVAAFLYARSGLGIHHGIIPANCVGVVDSDYRGEVKVGLRNTSDTPFVVQHGDRIAQMLIAKCELPEIEICDMIEETSRGSMGFGSSGLESPAAKGD